MNWHVTGDYYVDSKKGSDATGDGSQAMPYATINFTMDQHAGGTIVLACGEYNEVVNDSGTWALLSDGFVEMDGTSFVLPAFTGMTQITLDGTRGGFEIHDYFIFIGSNPGTIIINRCFCHNMVWRNSGTKFPNLFNSVFYNVDNFTANSGNGGVRLGSIRKNIFAFCETRFEGILRIDNNIYYECSRINYSNVVNVADYENIYNLNEALILSCLDATNNDIGNSPYTNLADFQADPATLNLNDNSTDVDPLLNLITPFDLTLPPNSPVANAGSDGLQIGPSFKSVSYDGLSPEFTGGGGAVLNNISVDPGNGDMTFTNNLIDADITTAVIDLGALQNPIGKVTLFGLQEFSNNRAIDAQTIDDLPCRVTFEARYSSISEADVLLQTFRQFEWNLPLTEDSLQRSNGDVNFDIVTETGISLQYIQFRIVFTVTHCP